MLDSVIYVSVRGTFGEDVALPRAVMTTQLPSVTGPVTSHNCYIVIAFYPTVRWRLGVRATNGWKDTHIYTCIYLFIFIICIEHGAKFHPNLTWVYTCIPMCCGILIIHPWITMKRCHVLKGYYDSQYSSVKHVQYNMILPRQLFRIFYISSKDI